MILVQLTWVETEIPTIVDAPALKLMAAARDGHENHGFTLHSLPGAMDYFRSHSREANVADAAADRPAVLVAYAPKR